MKKLIKRLFGLIILASLCVGGFYTAMGYGMYRSKVAEQSIEDRIEKVRQDADYTQLVDVPEIFIDAIISVEDSRFYKHSGVDIVALMRAMTANIRQKEFVQGGSTISQQFAKNLLFSHDQNLSRKIAELFATNYIEKNYEKDEILEAYINVIYYGDGYYNIREASLGYFGVLPCDLTPYQATMLAGIPNAPSVYAPTKNIDLAQKRQDKVLDRMVESGAITLDEMNEILKDRR